MHIMCLVSLGFASDTKKKHPGALLIHYDRLGLGALRNVNFVSILSKKKAKTTSN